MKDVDLSRIVGRRSTPYLYFLFLEEAPTFWELYKLSIEYNLSKGTFLLIIFIPEHVLIEAIDSKLRFFGKRYREGHYISVNGIPKGSEKSWKKLYDMKLR